MGAYHHKHPIYYLPSMEVEGRWFGLVLHTQDLSTLHSLSWLWTPLYTQEFQRPSVSQAKAWPKLGNATGQWSQTQQQIYNRMSVKEKNQGFVTNHSKSRLQLNWSAVEDFKRAVHKQMNSMNWSSVVKKSGSTTIWEANNAIQQTLWLL